MRGIHRHERGVSTQLSHVFGIAMTAILITVVLTGATTYVQNEQTSVVQSQLETIGDRLASEIERADELSHQGGDVTVRTTVQSTVSGQNYEVRLADRPACDTSNFNTSSCLVLEAIDMDVTTAVPLNVSNTMTVDSQGGGTYLLGVAGSGGQERTAARVNRPLRIGVGESFDVDSYGSIVDGSNQPPIPRFDFSPGVPTTGDSIQFSASRSSDQDGDIDVYSWDFDDDGAFEATGENVSKELDPGLNRVTLQVEDNEDATSNLTRTIRVSGVAYNGDLSETEVGANSTGESALNFTITNHYDEEISVKEVLIDPHDDALETLGNYCTEASECPFGSADNDGEIVINAGPGGSGETSVTYVDETIPSGGLIVELDEPATLDAAGSGDGASAEVWIGAFQYVSELNDAPFDLGVRYNVSDRTNSTVFTDVVGSPNIEEYYIRTGGGFSGGQVDGRIVADQPLQHVEIELGGDLTGTEERTVPTPESSSPGRYVYDISLESGFDSGVVKANLTVAEGEGRVSATETRGTNSINRSLVIFDGDYVWNSTSDWEAQNYSEGVVHDSVGDRRSDEVRLGYSPSDRRGEELMGYWHLDGSATDASTNGNDGADVGTPSTGMGVFGTSSYIFDGSEDYVTIGALHDIHTDTSSLSFWINTRDSGHYDFWQSPGITGVEQDGGDQDIFWGWIDDSGHIGIRAGNWEGPQSGVRINDGSWHHVVLTYHEDGEAEVYVDGEHEETRHTRDNDDIEGFSSLGRIEDTGGSPEHFEGKLDEVRSYEGVLNSSEVSDLADTSGSLVTGWKTGSQPLDSADATLQYDANVPGGTNINVTVAADTDGDGTVDVRSDPIDLNHGQRSTAVTGLGNTTASRYRLEMRFESPDAIKSPVLRAIGLREET